MRLRDFLRVWGPRYRYPDSFYLCHTLSISSIQNGSNQTLEWSHSIQSWTPTHNARTHEDDNALCIIPTYSLSCSHTWTPTLSQPRTIVRSSNWTLGPLTFSPHLFPDRRFQNSWRGLLHLHLLVLSRVLEGIVTRVGRRGSGYEGLVGVVV